MMSVGRVPDILFFGFKMYVYRYVAKTNDFAVGNGAPSRRALLLNAKKNPKD